jgi:hypothetical protein
MFISYGCPLQIGIADSLIETILIFGSDMEVFKSSVLRIVSAPCTPNSSGYMNFGPRIFRPNRFGPVRNSGDFSVRTESPIEISVQILNNFN